MVIFQVTIRHFLFCPSLLHTAEEWGGARKAGQTDPWEICQDRQTVDCTEAMRISWLGVACGPSGTTCHVTVAVQTGTPLNCSHVTLTDNRQRRLKHDTTRTHTHTQSLLLPRTVADNRRAGVVGGTTLFACRLPFIRLSTLLKQEVKVIWQKAPHGGPIPRLGVTPGGRKLYHWIPGVGFPISVP